MKKLKLKIREKGRFVNIPGMPPFRSPAKVDVSKIKLSVLIQSLHSCGVHDYEITSYDEKGEIIKYTNDNIEFLETKKDGSEFDSRLDRLEDLLLTLISKNNSHNINKSEQIENKLTNIEKLLKSTDRVYSDNLDNKKPRIEEFEEQFIPTIDIESMYMKNKSVDTVTKKSNIDVNEAVDLLSSLLGNGGSK